MLDYKHINGNLVSIATDTGEAGGLKVFPCGQYNGILLLKFLTECNDAHIIDSIYWSPTLRNFVSTYGCLPGPDEIIFKHGHKVRFIGTDEYDHLIINNPIDNTDRFHGLHDLDSKLNVLVANEAQLSYQLAVEQYQEHNNKALPYHVYILCLECNTINGQALKPDEYFYGIQDFVGTTDYLGCYFKS